MLTSFGMFWSAEGAGASWPGGDAALLAIIPLVVVASLAMVAMAAARGARTAVAGAGRMSGIRRFAAAVWEFVVGDDWITAVGVAAAIGLTAVVAATDAPAWWVMPAAALGLLAFSVRRAS